MSSSYGADRNGLIQHFLVETRSMDRNREVWNARPPFEAISLDTPWINEPRWNDVRPSPPPSHRISQSESHCCNCCFCCYWWFGGCSYECCSSKKNLPCSEFERVSEEVEEKTRWWYCWRQRLWRSGTSKSRPTKESMKDVKTCVLILCAWKSYTG